VTSSRISDDSHGRSFLFSSLTCSACCMKFRGSFLMACFLGALLFMIQILSGRGY